MARRNSALINVNGLVRFVEAETENAVFVVKTSDNNGKIITEVTAKDHDTQSKAFKKALHDVVDASLLMLGISGGTPDGG